jgi:hypothetical protein
MKVIDVHAHIGDGFNGTWVVTDEQLIETMKAIGVDKAVIGPIPGYADPAGIKDTVKQNNIVIDAMKKYPDFFPCGLGYVKILHGEANIDELKRILDMGLTGISMHPICDGGGYTDAWLRKILEIGSKRKGFVASLHTMNSGGGTEDPWLLADLAEEFPEITFINAHPAYTLDQWALSVWLSKKHENIYLDTALFIFEYKTLEEAVQKVGADRILFGSDLGYYGKQPSLDLIHVQNAELSDDEKELIFWKNAARLFNIKM